MTNAEWITEARQVRPQLRSLIENYHPIAVERAMMQMRQLERPARTVITARNAEAACANIRHDIIAKGKDRDPLAEFETALADGDIGTLLSLLNETWFGVPESTSCWSIKGFSEAVDLMDDPPDPPDPDTYREETDSDFAQHGGLGVEPR